MITGERTIIRKDEVAEGAEAAEVSEEVEVAEAAEVSQQKSRIMEGLEKKSVRKNLLSKLVFI